jgi:hypothetical protein
MATNTTTNTESTRGDGREDEKVVGTEAYHKLLRFVQHNTGVKNLPVCDITAVPATPAATRMAEQKEDIIIWTDDGRWTADGAGNRTRVGLTRSGWNKVVGTYPFRPRNLADILTIREIELARDNCSKAVIGWAEQHRIEIKERYGITEPPDKQSPGEKIRQRLEKK